MKNLHGFSTCEEDEVSLCEVDGRLHCMKSDYANISTFTNSVDLHPKIYITRDMLHCVGSGDESRALFLPVHEPFFKQVAKIVYEQGFTEALRFVTREHRSTSESVKIVSSWALKAIDAFSRVHNVIQPYRIPDRKNLVAAFSQTRSWQSSPIRCLAWHPHCVKIAVAASDDSVRIYSNDSNLVPILKSKLQKNISDIAWRPCSASEIAISCETCILIWTVDPNSVVTRPSTANSYILRRIHHSPVTSIAWSPHGECLVSASASDAALLVWDVALDQTCTLKRAGGVGNTLVQWSQDGSRLVAATSGLVFRVWDCRSWTADRWTITSGHIQSSCFSPCGSILLFVTSTEPILYSLTFTPSTCGSSSVFASPGSGAPQNANSPQQATPLLDLSRTELLNGERLVGGLVQKIEWCPSGRYLAVMFKESNYVAVCMVQIRPNVQVTPSSLVSGQNGEYPSTITFQKNFKDGSCLTIGWSSGRLQYFPLIYSDNKINNSPTNTTKMDGYDSSFRNNYSSF